MSTEVYVDRSGTVVLNDTSHSMGELMPALRNHPEIAALVTWTSTTLPGGGNSVATRHGSLFDRDRFVTPDNPYDQMRVAYDAATSDDVVGGTLDSMESLAFGRLGIECDDPDEEDIWGQWAEDVDIDARMREIWREQLITSNSCVAVWWGSKAYKVRGKSKAADGVARKRKKVFDGLTLPLGISVLDPLRILPVGGFLFNQERLAYIADWTEKDAIDSFLLGGDASGVEPIVAQLIVGKFVPDLRDRKQIGNLGVDPNRLYLLDPRKVFRMTPTRSQYERFAAVRLKSVFEILDAKHQLRQMDRAHLIGATNFIVLVRKGSKDRPAQQPEIDALQAGVRSLARVPVIVGDDRLSIEIITPKIDQTLNFDKYAGLDIRVQGRLYGMFITTRSRGDDSIKLARVVARGLEDKRDQQRRAISKFILNPAYQLNDAFTSPPSLRFYPKRIALDFDPALATYLLDLRDRGDLSRDSILSEIDYDEADEARKREYEAAHYDHIFQTQVPFSTPAGSGPGAANPGGAARATPGLNPGPSNRSAGRTGGRNTGGNRGGGGAAPGSGQGQAPRNGRPTPAQAAADVAGYIATVTGADRAAAVREAVEQLPHRTRAHAAAAAAMHARRTAAADDMDDALDAQRADLEARHAAELDDLLAAHAAETTAHEAAVGDLEDELGQHRGPNMPTGEGT